MSLVSIFNPLGMANLIDEAVLNGEYDEQIGNTESYGWYGLVRQFTEEDKIKALDNAADYHSDKDDLEDLDEVGAIVKITNDGFKYIEFYDNDTKMEKQWSKIVAQFNEDEDEDEDEDEEEQEED